MRCIKIDLVYGTIKIIMDLSSNFSDPNITFLNTLYWLLIFVSFLMLTLFSQFIKCVIL